MIPRRLFWALASAQNGAPAVALLGPHLARFGYLSVWAFDFDGWVEHACHRGTPDANSSQHFEAVLFDHRQ